MIKGDMSIATLVALKAARRATEYCLVEASAGANAGRSLIEAIDAARSIVRNRA